MPRGVASIHWHPLRVGQQVFPLYHYAGGNILVRILKAYRPLRITSLSWTGYIPMDRTVPLFRYSGFLAPGYQNSCSDSSSALST